MASMDRRSLRNEHPGMEDWEIARELAAQHHYLAVVRYKSHGAGEFTDFGVCHTEAEIRGYQTSPYCDDVEVIYDGRAARFSMSVPHVVNGECDRCGRHATRESLQLGAGNDFYFCPRCGLLFCDSCYPRLPLTASPGYGTCPTCRIQVKRTLPSLF